MDTILKNLHWRYATKKFDPTKKISEAHLDVLLESVRLSPSSFGIQPRKLCVVRDQTKKDALVQYARWQRQIADCSHLLVVCARTDIDDAYIKSYTDVLEQERNKQPGEIQKNREETGKIERIQNHYKQPHAAKQEVFLAVWGLLSACAQLHIDACPMGWFQPEKFDEVLWLAKKNCTAVLCCPVWYRAADDKYAQLPKVRFSREEICFEV